jgi:sarcosine oxidase, subunit gamma
MMHASLPDTRGLSIPTVSARFGIKGGDAPALLQHLGISVPPRPNSVIHWLLHEPYGSGRCLRQGTSEFLVELDAATIPLPPADDSFPGAWMLLRSDFSLVLHGAQWPPVLAQLCSFDFTRLNDEPDLVVMTLLAGVSVTLIREPRTGKDFGLRLWCDASFSVHVQQCLHSLGESR